MIAGLTWAHGSTSHRYRAGLRLLAHGGDPIRVGDSISGDLAVVHRDGQRFHFRCAPGSLSARLEDLGEEGGHSYPHEGGRVDGAGSDGLDRPGGGVASVTVDPGDAVPAPAAVDAGDLVLERVPATDEVPPVQPPPAPVPSAAEAPAAGQADPEALEHPGPPAPSTDRLLEESRSLMS